MSTATLEAPASRLRTVTVESRYGPTTVQTALTVAQAASALRIKPGISDFEQDIVRAADRHGDYMSDKQKRWLLVLGQQELDRVAAVAAWDGVSPRADKPSGFGPIMELFGTALMSLKRPKVRVTDSAGLGVVLTVAGNASRTPGSVHVTRGGAFGDRGGYLGRIDADGTTTVRDLPVLAVLRELAEDPADTIARLGRIAGACCLCGRPLTDARSTSVGYGPVCAASFGLPWGVVEVEV